jgi:hypothetical protein
VPVMVVRRHFGFFDILKQKLKEELEKSDDFRQKVKMAQDTETVQKAAEAAAAAKVDSNWSKCFLVVKLSSGHCRISCWLWSCGS